MIAVTIRCHTILLDKVNFSKSQYIVSILQYNIIISNFFIDIEENLRDKYDRLREYIVSLKKGHTSSLSSTKSYDKEIEDLEKKLADYRDIISQQELMLEVHIHVL